MSTNYFNISHLKKAGMNLKEIRSCTWLVYKAAVYIAIYLHVILSLLFCRNSKCLSDSKPRIAADILWLT